MGVFNIQLVSYETDNPTSLFFDNVCSINFLPYINITTRHSSRSKTLINNILNNNINGTTVSGNIASNI